MKIVISTIAAIAAVALCATAGAQTARKLEYKGVPFGASVTTFRAAHPTFDCGEQDSEGEMSCFASTKLCRTGNPPRHRACNTTENDALTYADETADPIIVGFTNGKLVSVTITFSPKSYEAIRDALSAKYGKPSDVTRTSEQTAFGLALANERVIWKDAGGVIHLKRYADKISEGNLWIGSASELANSEATAAKRAAKRRSNM